MKIWKMITQSSLSKVLKKDRAVCIKSQQEQLGMLKERKESPCGCSLRKKEWVKMQLKSKAWAGSHRAWE